MARFAARPLFLTGLLLAAVWLSSEAAHSREPARDSPVAERGVATIGMAELPEPGRRTQALIRQGGPFPYGKDGSVFGNRERQLPPREYGYYREYTVETPGMRDRGARRIVCGGPPKVPQACYYTGDHYASFRRIVE